MYRQVNRHIEAILGVLRKRENKHVRDYDGLIDRFRHADGAFDNAFQRDYVRFWGGMRGVNDQWRAKYFRVLHRIKNDAGPCPRQLLERICGETLGNRKARRSVEFSFATKLVHMVDPRSPIYDAKVRTFYLLPDATGGGDVHARIDGRLKVYDALVKEYDRVLKNGLLNESIARFRKELNPERFTDIKIVDSLIWAFVTWAKQGPAFLTGQLQYE